jgi:hypothetical protein
MVVKLSLAPTEHYTQKKGLPRGVLPRCWGGRCSHFAEVNTKTVERKGSGRARLFEQEGLMRRSSLHSTDTPTPVYHRGQSRV